MNDKTETAIDRALSGLAEEIARGTPRPGPDLLARVLADAASVRPPSRIAPARMSGQFNLGEWLFGWTGGAVATLSLCLSLGILAGLALDTSEIPIMGDSTQEMAWNTDGNLFSEEFL